MVRTFRFSPIAIALCAAFGLSAAHADPAPIVFAARTSGPSETGAHTLSGGSDTSYGYGARAPSPSSSSGVVIDIRRAPSAAPAPQVAPRVYEAQQQASAAPAAAGGERPGWLESERVGPPYEAGGRWYVPTPEPGYEQVGQASWYGPDFHGQATASGETYDQEALTAAHPTLPIPSLVQVTNLENGREVIVRVNDRGPYVGDRVIDLSHQAAEVLGFEQQGRARVHIRYLGPAPRHVDSAMLAPGARAPAAPVQQQQPQDGPRVLTPPPSAPVAAAQAEPVQQPQQSAPQRQAAPIGDGYMVQVGAFSDLSNAHRVREAVSTAGPVVVDTRQTAYGELFRVRVGPLASATEAETARAALAQLGYRDAIVAAP